MRDDLQGLEINPQELRYLTNLPVKYELPKITKSFQKKARQWMIKLKGSEGPTAIFLGLSLCVVTYLFFELIINLLAMWLPLPPIPSWMLLILSACFFFYGTKLLLYLLWKHRQKILNVNMTTSLETLLRDVDRYNAVIKSIDINDQIEAAGNTEVMIQNREKVIEALQMTRIELVRALKTEKILRENKKFIINNSELFTDNLTNLTATYVAEKASEHGRFLNEALRITLEVQDEMKKLQSQR
ncbi:MAG: hypothetical protein QNJ51_07410 [Calothrix sp. MO_167.B12]|nr:hypothetical protein [Calothrix sp. MO_167.B12]